VPFAPDVPDLSMIAEPGTAAQAPHSSIPETPQSVGARQRAPSVASCMSVDGPAATDPIVAAPPAARNAFRGIAPFTQRHGERSVSLPSIPAVNTASGDEVRDQDVEDSASSARSGASSISGSSASDDSSAASEQTPKSSTDEDPRRVTEEQREQQLRTMHRGIQQIRISDRALWPPQYPMDEFPSRDTNTRLAQVAARYPGVQTTPPALMPRVRYEQEALLRPHEDLFYQSMYPVRVRCSLLTCADDELH
jgi:hypothetical protein